MALMTAAYADHDGSGRPVMDPVILDRTVDAVSALASNAKVIGELVMNDEECAGVGRALAAGDAGALMRVYRAAMDRHVQELLDDQNHKRWERGLGESDLEAAWALQAVYA